MLLRRRLTKKTGGKKGCEVVVQNTSSWEDGLMGLKSTRLPE